MDTSDDVDDLYFVGAFAAGEGLDADGVRFEPRMHCEHGRRVDVRLVHSNHDLHTL